MSEEKQQVLALLRRLPYEQRRVTALAMDGLGPTEIADILNKPAETARSNLRHARARLSMTVTEGSDLMTVVGTFAVMSRGRRTSSRSIRRRGSGEERAEALQVYRESVGRLQHTAFRNLRQTIANATIFFAAVATFMIVIGEVTRARLPWYAASILGGALGLSTYAVRFPRPRLYLLIAAVALGVVGLAGAFVVK